MLLNDVKFAKSENYTKIVEKRKFKFVGFLVPIISETV